MKKRLLAGLLAAAMLTGLGSVVFAVDENGDESLQNDTPMSVEAITTAEGEITEDAGNFTVTFGANADVSWGAKGQGRNADAWWAGIKVTAPSTVTSESLKTVKITRQEQYSSAASDVDFEAKKDNDESPYYITMWVPVQPWYFTSTSLGKVDQYNVVYKIAWDGNMDSASTITMVLKNTIVCDPNGVPVLAYRTGTDELFAGFSTKEDSMIGAIASIVDFKILAEEATINKIVIDAPTTTEIKQGDQMEFTAKAYQVVTVKENLDKDFEIIEPAGITWDVTGASNTTDTKFNGNILHIAADETAEKLSVVAKSGSDVTSDPIEVTVTEKPASIPTYELTIATEDATEVIAGTAATATYTYTLKKTVDDTVTNITDATIDWKVARKDNAAVASGTAISNGVLTVAAGEPAGELIVTATYTPDAAEKADKAEATATITVKAAEEKPGEDDPKPDTTVATVDVAVAPASVAQGGTATVTVTAKNAAGETLTKDIAYKTASGKGTFNGNVLTVAEDETVGKLEIIVTIDGKEYKGSLDVTAKSSSTTTPGGNGGGSGSGSSGGGSSSGSGSTSAAPKTETTTVTETSAATQTTKAVEQAIAKAEKADADTATATVKVQNAKSISAKALESMVKAAEKAAEKKDTEVNLVLHADVVKNGKVESRLYIDPTKATLKSELKLGVTLGDQKVENKFDKYFENKIAVVKFDQVGTFGMNIKAAVKADLKGMNTRNLHFYSYDAKTNTYVKLANPKYWVDANGYLHFTTSQGNYVVVTDAPLVRK